MELLTQSKLESLIESCTTVGLGMIVSLLAWPFVGALYDIPYSWGSHFGITAIFTVLAVMRVYCVRRWFANDIKEKSKRLAFKLKSLIS